MKQGWQFVPRSRRASLFSAGGNMLRRVRGYQKLMEHLLAEARPPGDRRLAHEQHRAYSDYVLPAAGWYEKDDITWATREWRPSATPRPRRSIRSASRRRTGSSTACSSRSSRSAQSSARRRRPSSIATASERSGSMRSTTISRSDRSLHRGQPEELLDEILSLSPRISAEPAGKQLKEKGYLRFTGIGMSSDLHRRTHGDIEPDRDDRRQQLARPEEDPLADADAPHAVLHRPPLLPRSWGRCSRSTRTIRPSNRRRLPAADDRRPRALVDPRDVAGSRRSTSCSAASPSVYDRAVGTPGARHR